MQELEREIRYCSLVEMFQAYLGYPPPRLPEQDAEFERELLKLAVFINKPEKSI